MFDIRGDKIVLSPEDLAIPPFKEYYESHENKAQALKEIEYVVWLYKWNTPYEAYPEKERADKVGLDVFGEKHYIPSEQLKELAKRFKEFQETPGTRLLTAS